MLRIETGLLFFNWLRGLLLLWLLVKRSILVSNKLSLCGYHLCLSALGLLCILIALPRLFFHLTLALTLVFLSCLTSLLCLSVCCSCITIRFNLLIIDFAASWSVLFPFGCHNPAQLLHGGVADEKEQEGKHDCDDDGWQDLV